MKLRRIIKHVGQQDWTAVGLDFLIVVVGVFLGIQVSNWNDRLTDIKRENTLIGELRSELTESIRQTEIKREAYRQTAVAGAQALDFLETDQGCGNDCWPVVVAFFHASQWQQAYVNRSTYDEMRRVGWPRNRELVNAIENYHRQNDQITLPLSYPPSYRALVRGLIPLDLHGPYWSSCFELVNGEERYLSDCPAGVSPNTATEAVETIRAHPDIRRTLTEWAGFTQALPDVFGSQVTAAETAIALIDAEYGHSR